MNQEPFDIEGMTPIEVIEKISATILELTHQGVDFGHKKGYNEGYKDGMKEAVTTTTE